VRRDALTKLRTLGAQTTLTVATLTNLRTALNTALEGWKRPGAPQVPENARKAAEDLLKRIDEVYPIWAALPTDTNAASQAGPPLVERPATLPQRIAQVAGQIEGYSSPVNQWQLDQIALLTQKVNDAAPVVRKLAEELPAINTMMNEAGVPHIVLPAFGGGGGGRRPGDEEPEP
jgi:hypothetical protein